MLVLGYLLLHRCLCNGYTVAREWWRARLLGHRLNLGLHHLGGVHLHAGSHGKCSRGVARGVVISSATTSCCRLRRIRPLLSPHPLGVGFLDEFHPLSLALVLLTCVVVFHHDGCLGTHVVGDCTPIRTECSQQMREVVRLGHTPVAGSLCRRFPFLLLLLLSLSLWLKRMVLLLLCDRLG
jgi:hypothetical protein